MNKRTPDQIADESLLLKIASLAMRTSRKSMHSSEHINSPLRFTQPQLLTCPIVREVLRTTYRGVVERLALLLKLGKGAIGSQWARCAAALHRAAEVCCPQQRSADY